MASQWFMIILNLTLELNFGNNDDVMFVALVSVLPR